MEKLLRIIKHLRRIKEKPYVWYPNNQYDIECTSEGIINRLEREKWRARVKLDSEKLKEFINDIEINNDKR